MGKAYRVSPASFYASRVLCPHCDHTLVASCRYQLNFETPTYKQNPVAAKSAATAAAFTAAKAAAAVIDAEAKEGSASSENNKFAAKGPALDMKIRMDSLETRANECRQAAKINFQVGDKVSAIRELQQAKALETQTRETRKTFDDLHETFDTLELVKSRCNTQKDIKSITEEQKKALTDLETEMKALTDLETEADSDLKKTLDDLTKRFLPSRTLGEKEALLEELLRDEKDGDADGPYFKLQNQASRGFLTVVNTGKREQVIYNWSSDSGYETDDLLWSYVSQNHGHFKLKHMKTGKWLGPNLRINRTKLMVFHKDRGANQLWKFVAEDESSPLPAGTSSFRLETIDRKFLGSSEDMKTPCVYEPTDNIAQKLDATDDRDVWQAVPHGIETESNADTEGNYDTADPVDTDAAQKELLLAELKQMASAEPASLAQLQAKAKQAADDVVACDKLTATMSFIGALCLDHSPHLYSLFLATTDSDTAIACSFRRRRAAARASDRFVLCVC